MVMRDCLALANSVSPQTPRSFLSCIMLSSCQHFVIREYEIRLRRDETIEGKRRDRGISINHEQVLVEGRIDSNDVLDLVVDLEFQRVHGGVEVDLA